MNIQYKEPLKAIQFDGSNYEEIESFFNMNNIKFQIRSETFCWAENNGLNIGDWFVIKREIMYPNDRLFVVKKDEFDLQFIIL